MLIIYACFSSLLTVKTFFFSPRYQIKDEMKDTKYNAFEYSFIGTLFYGNPDVAEKSNDMKKDEKTSVGDMMKDVFSNSMMSWSYLAFIIFYSGWVLQMLNISGRLVLWHFFGDSDVGDVVMLIT